MNSGRSGEIITPPQSAHESALSATFRAIYSPDGKYVAFIGSYPNQISLMQVCVYDAQSWTLLKTIPFAEGGLSTSSAGLSFSPDSAYLAFGVTKLFIWRVSDWTLSQTIVGPYARGDYAAGNIQGLAFSPDGHRLAVLYSATFWPPTVDVHTSEEAGALEQAALLSIRAKKVPDFTRQAVIMGFDAHTGAALFSSKLSDSFSSSTTIGTSKIVYSNDGSQLIAAGRAYKTLGPGVIPYTDIFVSFLNGNNGNYIKSIHNAHSDLITSMSISKDNKTLFTGTNTGEIVSIYDQNSISYKNINTADKIRQWDIASGRQIAELGPISGPVKEIAMSRDGHTILACQNDLISDAIVTAWDAKSGRSIKSYRVDHNVRSHFTTCAISPDGETVVVPELRQIIGGGARPDKINILHINSKS